MKIHFVMYALMMQSALGFLHSGGLMARHSNKGGLVLRASTSTESTRFWETRQDGCWRPDVNDVDRISWGKPAKKKRTGSRGVPHRLNQEERKLYDLARQKGFLEVLGSSWRSQRRDSPLLNTYRSLCDARGQPQIVLHKDKTGIDSVVVDLSPLRLPDTFPEVAAHCSEAVANIAGEAEIKAPTPFDQDDIDVEVVGGGDDPWETRPIYQLSPFFVVGHCPDPKQKYLGKNWREYFVQQKGKGKVVLRNRASNREGPGDMADMG
eukprot:CAMPEP_0194048656 /NCGR_PEP_ID=MMETSP0009_2-20130614/28047_1 /TAXON_ID=210454 /ORGANISM="Grammatophora oceanica, Strain CCMP 410" /LENGTH=264 /DNA_ID=CAMNT_0038694587 /DNA_START=75 /DNA_END=866 /DNA_ORIENTATION=+